MTTIAYKIKNKTLVIIQFAIGALIMGAAAIFTPVSTFVSNPELITNPYMWGAVIFAMLFFGSIGYFGFVNPYLIFRRTPDVQAEMDGEYLYIYGKKEAKIPLSALKDAEFDSEIPYMMSKEFIVHLVSEEYGKVIIKVPEYGKFKLHFVRDARQVAIYLSSLADDARLAARNA